MIDKNKYPKTLEDFKKWFNGTHQGECDILDNEICYWNGIGEFTRLPEEMQTGVYLKYFDECKIHVEILPPYKETAYKYTVWSTDLRDKYKSCKTRILAIKSAMQKTSKIREKQLKENEKT